MSALLLALACASVLVACGGGGSSTASTEQTTATVPSSETGGEGAKPQSTETHPGGGKSEKKSGSGSESGGGSHAGERSASFRTPGGDNSIQEFGEEAGGSDRAKATATIRTYYSASEHKEWAKVCALLSQKNLAQIQQFASKIPKVKSKTCPGVIELVNAQTPGRPPDTMKGAVVSLRVEKGDGFALYHGIDGKPYSYTLKLENGEWKLTSLGPTPLSY